MVSLALFGPCFLCFWGFAHADGIIMQQGSSGEDTPRGVVLAADGLPVVCGTVAGWTSSDFPGTTGAGSWDGVVVKYNLDGTQAAIASFATNAEDEVRACVIDSSNNIYVSGFSRGLLPGTFEGGAAPAGIDMFVAKLDSSLNQQWLIQAGSTQGDDKASAIALDSAGNVVVGGSTAATWPEQTRVGSWDSFIIKYEVNNTGGSRQWVIQFGSVGADYLYGLTVDTVSDDIYAAGGTGGEFEGNTHQGGNDMYLIKVRDGKKNPELLGFLPKKGSQNTRIFFQIFLEILNFQP